jgi:uncharacterized membrane protein
MPLILASNFGDIAVAGLISQGFVVAMIAALLSLLLVLPKSWRKNGRWHGWVALIVSGVFFFAACYLLTTIQRSFRFYDLLLFGLFCIPALFALLSLFISRRKNAQISARSSNTLAQK